MAKRAQDLRFGFSFGAAAAALSIAFAPCAVAQPAKPPETAQQRFDSAQALFDKGKYDEALGLFQQTYSETKSPNARLMAARCLLALGKTADAYDELYATMREAATRAEKEPKYKKARDAAAAEIAVLEPKIGKIIVASVDSTATVTLNGSALPAERIGQPMAMLPGTIVLIAQKPDGTSVRKEETISAGDTKTVTLVFPSSASPSGSSNGSTSPSPSHAPDTSTRTEKTGGGVRIGGIIVTGIGVAGLATFGGTFAVAQSKYETLKNECHVARCTDPKYAGVVDSGKQMEIASDVSVAIGAAALVTGVVMIAVGGPKEKKEGASAALTISPTGLGLRGSF
jgi:hypothetical protein